MIKSSNLSKIKMFLSKIKFISKEIQNAIPHPHKMLHDHYALVIQQNKAIIFTKSPLKESKSYFISHKTIENETKNQYMSSHVYKIDPKILYLEKVPQDYLRENIISITKAYKSIDLELVIELIKYLPIAGGVS